MIIQCDGCGREIRQENAVATKTGEDTIWFCSTECQERGADLDSIQPGGAAERGGARGLTVTPDED